MLNLLKEIRNLGKMFLQLIKKKGRRINYSPVLLLSEIRCKDVEVFKGCRNVRKWQVGGCNEEEEECSKLSFLTIPKDVDDDQIFNNLPKS